MRTVLHLLLFASAACAMQTNAPDAWLSGDAHYPPPLEHSPLRTPDSALPWTLHAESVSGQVLVTCGDIQSDSASGRKLFLVSSADLPGHWPARDWRRKAMLRHGPVWQANIETDSVDVPIIYFVCVMEHDATNVSPMRICIPRALGIEHPSRLFWPFLEGFEQGLESWRALGEDEPPSLSPMAKTGKAALSVRIPVGRRSAVVATTRLRGWFAGEHRGSGVVFWTRTVTGAGSLRCTLFANALTTNEIAVTQTNAFVLSSHWQRNQLVFADWPKFPLGELDLIAFEYTGAPGTEFLLDNIYLTGGWMFE